MTIINIKSEDEYRKASVRSLGLSANRDYLVLVLKYPLTKALVVNLTTGKYFVLNESLASIAKGFVETIHTYSWLPDKNRLAFAFGNTSTSS